LASNSVASESWASEGTQPLPRIGARPWQDTYIRKAVVVDGCCALATGALAFCVRLYHLGHLDFYLTSTLLLPLVWMAIVAMVDGYAPRVIGVGSDEFRRILNAGLILTAGVAILSYAAKADVARGYVVIAFPSLTLLNLIARYILRKRLHHERNAGACMQRVVVVGYPDVVAEITMQLRREAYHGLSVVAACVAGNGTETEINGIPAVHGLDMVPDVVQRFGADTVAVTSCPEMSGFRLRELAWALEKTATSLCVAPALLEVAGQRTTIRPAAGLPLMYMEHPEFTGVPRLLKAAFDRTIAFLALLLLSPLMAVIALAIKLHDRGPALFSQVRVGVDGQPFKIYKFRTMVADAERQKALLELRTETGGVLFKMRSDPRITRIGSLLRRYSLDELPQLFNVLNGEMSLVGPRPALPEEADLYGDHVRRRLAVRPGITGLWQVNGRSDLAWDEAVRLDLRYVENWSFMLDLQILWKTWAAVFYGAGAY
jgi:exopolysaccharide biosynthesis polyprenyl glycosylphosphotransferase